MIEPGSAAGPLPSPMLSASRRSRGGIRALKILMEQECPTSRDEMARVSLCGGLALANAGLGVIHGLAGPLGGLSRASHGALCGSLLPFGTALNESQINDPGLRQRVNDVRRWLADGWSSLWIGSGTVCGNGAIALALAPCATSA